MRTLAQQIHNVTHTNDKRKTYMLDKGSGSGTMKCLLTKIPNMTNQMNGQGIKFASQKDTTTGNVVDERDRLVRDDGVCSTIPPTDDE